MFLGQKSEELNHRRQFAERQKKTAAVSSLMFRENSVNSENSYRSKKEYDSHRSITDMMTGDPQKKVYENK